MKEVISDTSSTYKTCGYYITTQMTIYFVYGTIILETRKDKTKKIL